MVGRISSSPLPVEEVKIPCEGKEVSTMNKTKIVKIQRSRSSGRASFAKVADFFSFIIVFSLEDPRILFNIPINWKDALKTIACLLHQRNIH